MKLFFVIFLFCFSLKGHAQDFAHSKEWLNLLYYKKTFLGYKSDVDDKSFFISPEGQTDPVSEYVFNSQKILAKDQSYICRFPARYKLITTYEKRDIDYQLLSQCEKYIKFMMDNYPKNIELVFSSYYLESPASAFGHTFLRFSKNDDLLSDKNSELLDTGINYGATNTSSNPFIYMLYGVIGGFRGEFAALPYYYKVREYNDFESRDIWSYQLNFTEKQKEKILDHVWELGSTWFYYYFFTENCSEKMLGLLDAVEPSWDLKGKIPFYVIPVETLKALEKVPELVKKVSFRPSKRKVFVNAYEQLSKNEKKAFTNYVDTRKDLPENEKNKAKILDTAIEYADYKYAKDILLERGEAYEWKKEILSKRSQVSERGVDLKVKEDLNNRPDFSHSPGKIKILGQKNEHAKNWSLRISHRFAFHEFTDPIKGSPEFAQINFLKMDATFKDGVTRLEKVDIVDVATLNPWGYGLYPKSLRANISLQRDQIGLCQECKSFDAFISGGPSFSFLNDRFILYLFTKINAIYATDYENELELNPGLSVGSIIRLNELFSLHVNYQKAYALLNKRENYQFEGILEFHHLKDFDTTVEVESTNDQKKLMLGLSIFY